MSAKPRIVKRAGFWQVEASPGAIERLVLGSCDRQEAHCLSAALRWCSVQNATGRPPTGIRPSPSDHDRRIRRSVELFKP